MEEIKNCPNCTNEKFTPFLSCKDFTVTNELFNLATCTKCGFVLTNPRPGAKEIGKYYESKDYISHSNTKEGIINKVYHFVKTRAIRKKIKLITNLNPPDKTLLDIGCGTGDFMGKSKENGWQVIGIEPNKEAREISINKYNSIVYDEGGIQLINNQSISIITMWHVLEHVHDLNLRIKEINNLLKPGGYAVIAVPNYTSWDAKHYGKFWAAYDVPRHLYHFSPEIIKTLFSKHNLFHVSSLPMKMDAYYVSMLSEKYKNSFLGLIRAICIGFTSNFKTKNNAEKYSSVIYIFKKK